MASNKQCTTLYYCSLSKISQISNQTTANALVADLNQTDDTKRTLKSIDTASVSQLFTIFGIKDPGCDKNSNQQVEGD
jgi:hypothetical protein